MGERKCPQSLVVLPIGRDMAILKYLPFAIRTVLATEIPPKVQHLSLLVIQMSNIALTAKWAS